MNMEGEEMRIHGQIQIRSNQRDEDADGKGRQTQEPGYVYTWLDTHTQEFEK